MSLRFPYQAVPIIGPIPPNLPAGSTVRWRPLIPVRVANLDTGQLFPLDQALVDTGADDTILPMTLATTLGIPLLPITASGHAIRWRGNSYTMRFGEVSLELDDGVETWKWTSLVAFSPAPLRYPLLGHAGFSQYFDVTFAGAAPAVLLETNPSFAGTKT